MTDTELHEINAALEEAGGDRAIAALILETDVSALANKIHDCPALRLRWATARVLPPDVADAVNREAREIGKLVGGDLVDPKMALSVAKQDRQLANGLAGLGLSEKAIKLAKSFHEFQSKNFSRSATIVAGGLIRRYCENEARLDELWQEWEKEKNSGGFDPENPSPVCREQFILNSIINLTAVQQKAYKLIVDAGLTSALIAQKMAALNGDGGEMKKVGKPGFGPKQRTVEKKPQPKEEPIEA